jgi:hypothetical protein
MIVWRYTVNAWRDHVAERRSSATMGNGSLR